MQLNAFFYFYNRSYTLIELCVCCFLSCGGLNLGTPVAKTLQ